MFKRTPILLLTFVCMAFAIQQTNLEYPKHFPEPSYDFSKNPLNEEAVFLGRALFYDPILSKDSTISCASCHSPYNAFAHTDHALSHGINDSIGTRNAPALFNLAWQTSFNWDGAVNHLDMQALAPINNPIEMGETTANVVAKLNQSDWYRERFYAAFQDSVATGEYLLKALAQFQLTLISANSKYDQVKNGEAVFTEQEQKGYDLFKKNCASCHTEPLFTNGDFANNGLPIDSTLNDFGKFSIGQNSKDSLLFKVPTLRNLKYTYPYMHDGRFRKLNEVIRHYVKEIVPSETLAPQLRDSVSLTSNERVDLVAFLLTLDDPEFVFNRKHQFPMELLKKNQ